MVVVCLRRDVQVRTISGSDIIPKARKARGLLALIAMSDTNTISRADAVAILWSSIEQAIGLARLRDVLHDLRKELQEKSVDFLTVDGDMILFKANLVVVDVTSVLEDPHQAPWSELLEKLEGVDPAFNRWLAHIRAKKRRANISLIPAVLEKSTTVLADKRYNRPVIAILEVEAVGELTTVQWSRSLTDELGRSISRFRWFITITRDLHGQRLRIGRDDLSSIADYALVGTLQCETNYSRLLLKLIDLQNFGAIEWSSSFERHEAFSLTVQEAFSIVVAARVETELLFVEVRRVRRRTLGEQEDAYNLVLQAISAIYQLEHDSFVDAGHLLERAWRMDRESSLVNNWLAYWHIFFVGQGWASNPSQSMKRAASVAERAMMLDPKDARAATVYGHVKAFFNRQFEEAVALHKVALQLNPAQVLAWHFLGVTNAYAGHLDEALSCIARCRELAPNDPQAFYVEGALCIVLLLQHNHEGAATIGCQVTERNQNFTSAYKCYLAALGHLGRRSEASSVLKRLLVLEPQFCLHRFRAMAPYRRKQDMEHFVEGLRLAGVT